MHILVFFPPKDQNTERNTFPFPSMLPILVKKKKTRDSFSFSTLGISDTWGAQGQASLMNPHMTQMSD